MSFLTTFKTKLEKALDEPSGKNPFIDVLIKVEQKTHIPRFEGPIDSQKVCHRYK